MEKLKVMTIIGTRPEIIRLSEVIRACDCYFRHILVHTGQNWDDCLKHVFFEELGIREPDYYLDAAGGNLGQTLGNIIARSYDVLLKEKPDALLILGDTNSALCAVPAKRLKIPIFHMEAGNRCFDENVPEEINRRIVDHISDIHLPYTEHSRRYLLAEGISRERIFVTGSPMTEVLHKNLDRIRQSKVLEEAGLDEGRYIVLSAHREENIDNERNLDQLVDAFNCVAEEYQLPIMYSTHPRSWKRIEEGKITLHPLIRKVKPFGFFDYNKLQIHAFCVLSDSGTLSEESAILGFPAVLIRTSTERPEVLDKGTLIIGGVTRNDVLQAIELCRAMWDRNEKRELPPDYLCENVSARVVAVLQSYAKLINR